MQTHFDLIDAQLADAIDEVDLLVVHFDAALGEGLDDLLGADGTEELGLVRHAGGDLHGHALQALGQLLGIDLALSVGLCSLFAEHFDLPLGRGAGRDGEQMGEEIVAGVAVGNLDDVAHAAELEHIFDEEDFLFRHGSPHSPT